MVSGNETRGKEEGGRKEGDTVAVVSCGLGIPEMLTNRKKKKRRKPRRGSRIEKKKKKNKNRPILPFGPIHRLPAKRREGEEGGRKEREGRGRREGGGREREGGGRRQAVHSVPPRTAELRQRAANALTPCGRPEVSARGGGSAVAAATPAVGASGSLRRRRQSALGRRRRRTGRTRRGGGTRRG